MCIFNSLEELHPTFMTYARDKSWNPLSASSFSGSCPAATSFSSTTIIQDSKLVNKTVSFLQVKNVYTVSFFLKYLPVYICTSKIPVHVHVCKIYKKSPEVAKDWTSGMIKLFNIT